MSVYGLFDIGATKMRVALTRDATHFSEPKILSTPRSFNDAVNLFVETVSSEAGGEKVLALAGGIAGSLDKEKLSLRYSHLIDWIGKPLRRTLEERFAAPIYIENDASIVGLGEAVSGAGLGNEIVAYITVSTGVGGARIVEGKIDRNASGFEPGHQIIDAGGSLCPTCGDAGHLEGYVSGSSLERRFGKKPQEIKDSALWTELAEWLSLGLANTAFHWSPHILVLGGPMIIGDPAINFDVVRQRVGELMSFFVSTPEIRKAELGDIGGIYGALAYVNEKLRYENKINR